jgi:hypothetical protein
MPVSAFDPITIEFYFFLLNRHLNYSATLHRINCRTDLPQWLIHDRNQVTADQH